MDLPTLTQIAIPALCVVAGFIVGWFLEKVVLRQLTSLADITRWRADNVIFASFRGIPVFWGTAAGIYVATLTTQAGPEVVALLEKLLIVAVLWSFTIIAARMSAGLISAYASRDESFLPPTSIIPNLVQLLLYAVGLLIILNELDISITPLLTALGVGGLAVALALQETLANVFAGLYLLAARQIKPGDYVRLDTGDEGYVADMNWRSTTVRTILDNMVIVPNAKLASAIVTNYHLPATGMLVRIALGVDYESDLEQVERVTLEVARETLREVSGTAPAQPPLLFFHGFGEFSLNLVVLLRVREYFDQYRARHLFIKRLLARFQQEGIRIPFPIREFQMQVSSESAGVVSPPDASASAVDANVPDAPER